MMGFTFEDIVQRIREEKGVSDDEIERRVKQKLDKLSGLISKEGAAHIVANELGVDLISSMKKHGVRISQVMPGMRNITIVGKVTKDYGLKSYQKEGREGKVWSFLVGDESGVIRVVVWDTDIIGKMEASGLSEGQVIRASDGIVKDNNGYREMHLGNRSMLEINPEGVQVKNVSMKTTQNFMRRQIKDLREGEFVSLVGTVVQVFEPRFYEGCKEGGKKLDNGCKEHGNVDGKMVPILNFYLDDGTGNIHTIAFRDLAGVVMNLPIEKILEFQQQPGSFEAVKNDFLGRQLVVGGKVQKNIMFDRVELIANSIEEAKPEDLAHELGREMGLNE